MTKSVVSSYSFSCILTVYLWIFSETRVRIAFVRVKQLWCAGIECLPSHPWDALSPVVLIFIPDVRTWRLWNAPVTCAFVLFSVSSVICCSRCLLDFSVIHLLLLSSVLVTFKLQTFAAACHFLSWTICGLFKLTLDLYK